jgi:hypothetical protein
MRDYSGTVVTALSCRLARRGGDIAWGPDWWSLLLDGQTLTRLKY